MFGVFQSSPAGVHVDCVMSPSISKLPGTGHGLAAYAEVDTPTSMSAMSSAATVETIRARGFSCRNSRTDRSRLSQVGREVARCLLMSVSPIGDGDRARRVH